MLKIRISGTEGELRQVAHKAGSTRIKRFKRENGKTMFAIDVEISVRDFLDNLFHYQKFQYHNPNLKKDNVQLILQRFYRLQR